MAWICWTKSRVVPGENFPLADILEIKYRTSRRCTCAPDTIKRSRLQKMIKNIMACLVHEKEKIVWDLVRNLRYLDPTSHVLLYNNSENPNLLVANPFKSDPLVTICPIVPKLPLKYGALHFFMRDCMQWSLEHLDFDTITNVDSDQILLRPGYSEAMDQILKVHPNFGMLASPPATPSFPTNFSDDRPYINYPEECARAEMWRLGPILDRWDTKLVWSFWPGVCFGRKAAIGIVDIFQHDTAFQEFLSETRIFATEELFLPTIVSHLKLDIITSPFNLKKCVLFWHYYTLDEISSILSDPSCQWIHPVPRVIDNSIRARVRILYNNYRSEIK